MSFNCLINEICESVNLTIERLLFKAIVSYDLESE